MEGFPDVPNVEDPQVWPVAVYLAGPMHDFTGDYHHHAAKDWREDISKQLPPNVVVVSPAHAFFGASPQTAPAIDRIERFVIQACDAILVNLTEPDVPAFGSIRDIEFGKRTGKVVAVAGDIKSLMTHDLIVRPSLDEAFQALLFKVADERNAPRGMFGLPILRFQVGEDE